MVINGVIITDQRGAEERMGEDGVLQLPLKKWRREEQGRGKGKARGKERRRGNLLSAFVEERERERRWWGRERGFSVLYVGKAHKVVRERFGPSF